MTGLIRRVAISTHTILSIVLCDPNSAVSIRASDTGVSTGQRFDL